MRFVLAPKVCVPESLASHTIQERRKKKGYDPMTTA
jgi:hypothetical protein